VFLPEKVRLGNSERVPRETYFVRLVLSDNTFEFHSFCGEN
jgi:hypothetical protein